MDFRPNTLRRHVLHMAHRGQSVHVACAFSMIEVLSLLYSKHLKFNPENPDDPSRDFFLLSKGHGVMALYACMREIGWLKQTDLDDYFKDGSLLHGLSEDRLPGCEVSSGSLGHGLPVAAGIALGLKWQGLTAQKVYCVIGDGELNEGSMWEAITFAGHHQLDNLIVIVDANRFQAMGLTKDVLDMEPLQAKFESFGFETAECDGHDLRVLDVTLNSLKKKSLQSGKPMALIARTEKGKGVSFMESDNKWHYTRIDDATLESSLKELELELTRNA